ncbi:MAG: (2Fe-2S)-binding protein [Helicobacteraceae bacterium]|jgi:NADH dehydrogenase/NADH:ubiquinone oxidoreductase subunit G|nr:(2Fe-2S)-binding protein [Helicobacteraceae bacterium]
MVNITINGRLVGADENETILQAARRVGKYIPMLCFLSKVSDAGERRLCVVNIAACRSKLWSI